MESKDTMMNTEQLTDIVKEAQKYVAVQCECAYLAAQAQAEISFGAGIREVVEWIEQYSHASMRDIFGDDWRAKLKEWGIE